MEQAPFLQSHGHKHAEMEYFAKYLISIQDLSLDDLWKFAFVRNPYERFVSGMLGHTIREALPFELLRQLGDENLDRVSIKPIKDRFTEFVYNHKDRLRDFVPLRPMTDFVCIGQTPALDFVGRYENLQEDWRKVCDHVGVKFDLPHQVRGRMYGTDYMDFYIPETKKIVSEFYARDFELFGYQR
jgi:hypothetical protein